VSAFIANCRVTILDTAYVLDGNGDEKPNDVIAAEHLPAFWAQKDQRTKEPTTGEWSVTRGYLVRLRPGTVITEDQRVRRESDGLTARVNRVGCNSPLPLAGDVVVRAIEISR
jgi:hypothetical protein